LDPGSSSELVGGEADDVGSAGEGVDGLGGDDPVGCVAQRGSPAARFERMDATSGPALASTSSSASMEASRSLIAPPPRIVSFLVTRSMAWMPLVPS
jgi:hypothetical protein